MIAKGGTRTGEVIYTYNFEFSKDEDALLCELLERFESYDLMCKVVNESEGKYNINDVQNFWQSFIDTFLQNIEDI